MTRDELTHDPEAIKLLNAQKDDPSPRTDGLHPPTGGTPIFSPSETVCIDLPASGDDIKNLNDWVQELERAIRRVEDRVDTHELYLSQAQNDYDKRRDE
jgi:hypothetical protein